jgi:hypothetical protein
LKSGNEARILKTKEFIIILAKLRIAIIYIHATHGPLKNLLHDACGDDTFILTTLLRIFLPEYE